MSGMDRIVETISREAGEKAEEILSQAKAQAAAIEQNAAAKREEHSRKAEELAQKEAENVLARYASENRRQRKEALLKAKSALVEDVIREAKDKILSLPESDYFDLMQRLFERNVQPGNGKLYFAKKDYDRLPDGWMQRIAAAVQGGGVELAGSTDKIAHGFVIVYGKIEQNCSLESIFESERSRMVDAVNACLEQEA